MLNRHLGFLVLLSFCVVACSTVVLLAVLVEENKGDAKKPPEFLQGIAVYYLKPASFLGAEPEGQALPEAPLGDSVAPTSEPVSEDLEDSELKKKRGGRRKKAA